METWKNFEVIEFDFLKQSSQLSRQEFKDLFNANEQLKQREFNLFIYWKPRPKQGANAMCAYINNNKS